MRDDDIFGELWDGWDFGLDFDGNVQSVNPAYVGMKIFICPGCSDPTCRQQWIINADDVQWNGDILDQCRKAFGSRRPDGVLWGNHWASLAKGKNPTMTRVDFFGRSAHDLLQYIDEEHVMLFAKHTTVVREGARELMAGVAYGRGTTPILSNGLGRWMLPLIAERFADVLGKSPIYCNTLLGDPIIGYSVRGYNGCPDGVPKHEIVKRHPRMMAYAGDTTGNDLLVAEAILERGGIVFCTGDKAPGSLYDGLQEKYRGSDRVHFIGNSFAKVPTVIRNSAHVLKPWKS